MLGNSMRAAGVIRGIMAVGGGIMIAGATGTFLCMTMFPLVTSQCVQVDQSMLDTVFKQGGFVTQLIGTAFSGTMGATFIYYLTGKWIKN